VQGLKGEYIVDDRTWIIKAHHPMLLPGALSFNSDKIVCCVRNPLDVFQSFASLSNTMSHSGQPDYKYHEDYPEWWDWWVTFCTESHARFFETTLRQCNKEGQNPIYITRYEDLVNNPRKELEGIFKFLLDVDSIEGTNAERRLDQIMAMGADAAKSYATKQTTGKFNAHRSKYTDSQIDRIRERNAELLYYFGYANHPDQENHTAFFEFKDHKPEHLEQFYGYRKDNEKFLKQLAKEGGWKGPKYGVNVAANGGYDFYPADKMEYV
jgi:hypothetical protein